MTEISLETANERNAGWLLNFADIFDDAVQANTVGRWNRVFIAMGCLYTASRTPYFPNEISIISPEMLRLIASRPEPRLLAVSGRYPITTFFLLQQFSGNRSQQPLETSYGFISSLLDLAASLVTDEDIIGFFDAQLFAPSRDDMQTRYRNLTRQILRMRSPYQFFWNYFRTFRIQEGFRKFLDISFDITKFIDRFDTLAGDAIGCFSGLYVEANPLSGITNSIYETKATQYLDLEGWLPERLKAVERLHWASIELMQQQFRVNERDELVERLNSYVSQWRG